MKKFKTNLIKFDDCKNAFSLMEMMVVLLIVAIIAAVSAPMVTKKALKDASKSGGSPILWANTENASLPTGNLIVGDTTQGNNDYRMFVQGSTRLNGSADIGNNARGTTTNLNGNTVIQGNFRLNTGTIRDNTNNNEGSGNIIIQRTDNTVNLGDDGVNETHLYGTTVLHGELRLATAKISDDKGNVLLERSVSNNNQDYSFLDVGSSASEVRIGANNSHVWLGGSSQTVYVPGQLLVGPNRGRFPTYPFHPRLMVSEGFLYIDPGYAADFEYPMGLAFRTTGAKARHGGANGWAFLAPNYSNGDDDVDLKNTDKDDDEEEIMTPSGEFKDFSDRRLKNVGEKYTAGIEELKKLNFFHYTFKKDKTKTPHVGVIAQDLQEVFPDAVTKGEDEYLRIRWDEMFFAVINAVKQLDEKIAKVADDVKANFDKTAKLEATVAEQQKTIESQQQMIDELVKRVSKLEKKSKKNQE